MCGRKYLLDVARKVAGGGEGGAWEYAYKIVTPSRNMWEVTPETGADLPFDAITDSCLLRDPRTHHDGEPGRAGVAADAANQEIAAPTGQPTLEHPTDVPITAKPVLPRQHRSNCEPTPPLAPAFLQHPTTRCGAHPGTKSMNAAPASFFGLVGSFRHTEIASIVRKQPKKGKRTGWYSRHTQYVHILFTSLALFFGFCSMVLCYSTCRFFEPRVV